MATRKIIDAKHKGEKVWLKGHAQATFMSNGTTVEDAINQIGAGGGIIVETDPIFSASPAASITEEKKTEWDNKMDKVILSPVATSGSYNDLTDKPTIPVSVTESVVSGWGFTKNTGTVTGVKINGITNNPSNGVVNLGYVNKGLLTSASSSMQLFPNLYYRNTSTSLSTLTITLGSASNSDIINEYFVEFTTRSTGTTVSLPSSIKWANGETPTFENGKTYQISIVNNLGVCIKFG